MKNYLAVQLYRCARYPFLFVVILWVIFFLQHNYEMNFLRFGVVPRTSAGLPGILTSVLVHGDLHHIFSNTFPLLVLGMMLFYFYRKIALPVALWIWLISGLWLWVGGRNSAQHPMHHIGASTLIYGLASFLFFSGILRRHTQLMVVSLLVVFLYGSITWGIFPFKTDISWEGHLFGAIAGLLVAVSYRKEGPQRKLYSWELEEDEAQPPDPEDTQGAKGEREHLKVVYHYRKKDASPKNQGEP